MSDKKYNYNRSVHISDAQHKALEARKARSGQSIVHMVSMAIKRYLNVKVGK